MSKTAENIKKAFIVPGQPHLVLTDGWKNLSDAFKKAGEDARATNPDVIVIYSAQWMSVLGHSFQGDPNPKGLHVDENWHDMGDLPFDFKVDVELAKLAEQKAQAKGLATQLVNYEGFPIDTGAIVTLKCFNPDNKTPVVIVSSNVYANKEDSLALGEAMGEALKESGKTAAVIFSTAFSHRFITEEIQPSEDKISSEKDDEWNRKMLDLIQAGKNKEAMELIEDFAKNAAPEMMFKGFYWLMGVLGTPDTLGDVLAYGPVWGTGNAVVEYSLNN